MNKELKETKEKMEEALKTAIKEKMEKLTKEELIEKIIEIEIKGCQIKAMAIALIEEISND